MENEVNETRNMLNKLLISAEDNHILKETSEKRIALGLHKTDYNTGYDRKLIEVFHTSSNVVHNAHNDHRIASKNTANQQSYIETLLSVNIFVYIRLLSLESNRQTILF
ncbi:unnamed protein product [Anisakis simplex]|uniref:Uncharacterized protein n=1 Tax=Anisakis simplex TaxID=6269 RepID=A0A0M3JBT6_ANISI|nr:unnamed protein product [Anisakis simplex]